MSDTKDIWLLANNMIPSGRQILNENLRPLNLSSVGGNIFLHLMTLGQEMRQEQLVERLDISKPAVSRTRDSLEVKNYVLRQPDPNDKRSHRIRLTKKFLEIELVVERIYNQVYTLAIQGITL
jgi:DNA-binding MarR family transcriptional regulator